MNIAICDDDVNITNNVTNYINNWGKINDRYVNIKVFHSAEEFLGAWEDYGSFDLLFLDISMKLMDGITLAKKIREQDAKIMIVFITGLAQYALKGYEVAAMNYLVKPFKERSVHDCLQKTHAIIVRNKRQTLIVPHGGILEKIFYDDIFYVTAFSHTLKVHTIKGIIEYPKKIGDLEQELPSDTFIRAHRSNIIHIKYINSIFQGQVKMDNGDFLPVSRTKYELINSKFLLYNRNINKQI